MLRLGEMFVVMGILIGLASSGFNLKTVERRMFHLAVESYQQGYPSIQGLEQQLEKGH